MVIHPASRGVAAHTAGFFGPWQGLRVVLNRRTGFVSKSFAAIRSPGRPRPRFLPVLGSSQWVLFYVFPRVGASQAREFQIATTTTPRKTVRTTFCTVICIFFQKILQIQCFLKCVCMFLQCFPSKHGSLHMCRCKPFQSIIFSCFLQCVQFPYFPKPLKTPLFTLFSSIFPCSNAAGQLKHIYKKVLQTHCFFDSVFTMVSVKKTVIYTFFGIKSGQNTDLCSVFNALASKNPSTYHYL